MDLSFGFTFGEAATAYNFSFPAAQKERNEMLEYGLKCGEIYPLLDADGDDGFDPYAATPSENAFRMACIAESYRRPNQHRGLMDRQGFIRRAQNSCARFATFAATHGDEPEGEEVGEPTPIEMFPSMAERLMHFMAGAQRNSPEFWAEVNSWTAKK